MRSRCLCVTTSVALVAFALASSVHAGPVVTRLILSDHPDGNRNPPPYGVRFDNIFTQLGLTGGVTSFSMDHFGAVILTVTDDTANLGVITLNINGKVYGGVDTGSTYGFGEGAYMLDFTYTTNVVASGTGWRVDPQSTSNSGTLTALAANAGVPSGSVFSFRDKSKIQNNTLVESFLVLQDEHRLAGHPQAGQGYWVGRGWLKDSFGTSGTHDFLFIAKVIPLPGAAAMAGTGILVLGTRRRRQAQL